MYKWGFFCLFMDVAEFWKLLWLYPSLMTDQRL